MEERILYTPKVRTELFVRNSGLIRLSPSLVSRLGVKSGDAIELMQFGVELMLTGLKQGIEQPLQGTLVRVTSLGNTLQLYSRDLANLILANGDMVGKYRCGDAIKINKRIFVPIITRKNYANQTNTAIGNK